MKLVEHAINWKELFMEEKDLLNEAIGMHVVDIQHIGSTAIDGIAAKPLSIYSSALSRWKTYRNLISTS